MSPPSLATFWTQASLGVSYVRCELPARYLPGKVRELGYGDVVPDIHGQPHFPNQEGAAVWSFPGNATRGLIIAGMQKDGIPVYVESDDNYFVQPPSPPGTVGRPWQRRIDPSRKDMHSLEAHVKIASFADGVIVSTEALAREYREVNANVHVCPNSVDPTDWEDTPREDDGIFRIGFAGSASHWIDLPLIFECLAWASRQPDVEVIYMGNKSYFPAPFEYTHVGWTDDLAEFRRNLLQLDVGLCPLRPGRWANCKSDVKALEYTMAGAAVVCSRVEPYKAWARKPCIPVANQREFTRAVKHLVKRRDEARQIAQAAKEYVLAERTAKVAAESWRAAIGA